MKKNNNVRNLFMGVALSLIGSQAFGYCIYNNTDKFKEVSVLVFRDAPTFGRYMSAVFGWTGDIDQVVQSVPTEQLAKLGPKGQVAAAVGTTVKGLSKLTGKIAGEILRAGDQPSNASVIAPPHQRIRKGQGKTGWVCWNWETIQKEKGWSVTDLLFVFYDSNAGWNSAPIYVGYGNVTAGLSLVDNKDPNNPYPCELEQYLPAIRRDEFGIDTKYNTVVVDGYFKTKDAKGRTIDKEVWMKLSDIFKNPNLVFVQRTSNIDKFIQEKEVPPTADIIRKDQIPAYMQRAMSKAALPVDSATAQKIHEALQALPAA